MKKYIIPFIILSGVFTYKVGEEVNRFSTAQLSFFLLGVGVLGGIVLWKKNKLMGMLSWAYSFGVFKSLLLQDAPKIFIYGTVLVGTFMFIAYYLMRRFKVKEDILKWFLIPAGLNIILIFLQKFDAGILRFMPIKEASGFIGNGGFASIYLALTTPLFIKYFKPGIPFLMGAIIICNGGVGFIACVISGLVYLFHTNKKVFKISLAVTAISLFIYLPLFFQGKFSHRSEVKTRLAMFVGALDGLRHNPILGYGVGSFIPVIAQRDKEGLEYFGVKLKNQDHILNHPHNEFLFGWWNAGIVVFIVMVLYCIDIIRKFTKEKVLSFSMLIAGMVCMFGYFLRLPVWLMLLTALAAYENGNNREVCNG